MVPSKPRRPCAVPGCPNEAVVGSRCAEHSVMARQMYERDRPSAAARGYDQHWRRVRAAYIKAHPYCCVPGCGEPTTDVDHVIRLADGGTNQWSNLQGFCHRHHSSKTASEDGRWGEGRRNR